MIPHLMLKRVSLAFFTVVMTVAFVLPFILPPASTSPIFDSHLNEDPFTLDFKNNFSSIDVPEFTDIQDVKTKKHTYFQFIGKLAYQNNQLILRKRSFIQNLVTDYASLLDSDPELSITEFQAGLLSSSEQDKLQFLLEEYRIKSHKVSDVLLELLLRVNIIPIELIQVQTANESGWGTSRFAVQGYNFFGLWCYQTGCGFVPKHRTEGMTHEVAKFSTPAQGMYRYVLNLNRNKAYRQLQIKRQALLHSRKLTSFELAMQLTTTLEAYSERGQAYIDELQSMLRVNRSLLGIDEEILKEQL